MMDNTLREGTAALVATGDPDAEHVVAVICVSRDVAENSDRVEYLAKAMQSLWIFGFQSGWWKTKAEMAKQAMLWGNYFLNDLRAMTMHGDGEEIPAVTQVERALNRLQVVEAISEMATTRDEGQRSNFNAMVFCEDIPEDVLQAAEDGEASMVLIDPEGSVKH